MTQAIERDVLAEFRPRPQTLMLMLRAAAVHDDAGGPWLTLMQSRDGRAMTHHITMTEPSYSLDRLVMCSGVELLGKYCALTSRVPASITAPELPELRALGDWAVKRVNAPLWHHDFLAWRREFEGPLAKDRRHYERQACEQRVQSFRWLMAEEWLS